MDHTPPKPTFNRTDLLALAVLLLAGLKFTAGFWNVLDVSLYDESSYLHSGAVLARQGLPSPVFAPLYAVWYYLLSLVQPDRVNLYYLNYQLTTVLPPLFVYLLLRSRRVTVVTALIISAYLSISQALFITWPRVSHFALIIILAACTLAGFVRRGGVGVLIVAFSALLASYVRPEYFLAFPMLVVFGAALCIREARRGEVSPGWVPLGTVVLSAVVLMATVGPPAFGKGGEERHLFAFMQHYALNWADWNGRSNDSTYNPGTNFREIAAKDFGDAPSVSSAIRRNPGAAAHHVLTNIRRLLPRFPGLFMHHANIVLPNNVRCENIEARVLLIGLLVLGWFRRKAFLPFVSANVRQEWLFAVCVGLLCVPTAVSAVEIYPHDHYLLLPGTLLIALAAVCLRGDGWQSKPAPAVERKVVLAALAILIFTPMLSHRQAVPKPIVETIRAIAALNITTPHVNLLEAEGGYDFYLTANYHRVAEYDKHVPFDQFASAEGINMVALSERLEHDSHLAPDPLWQSFLTHYRDAGFESRAIPGCSTTLLVRRELLSPDPAP